MTHPSLFPIHGHQPDVHPSAFVAPGAFVFGKVTLAARSSVWFNSVLRADLAAIDIGEDTNIQDGSVLHVDHGYPLHVGPRVTIGHKAMLHGCVVAEESLIGINAVLLNGCTVGRHCIVGAGSLLPEGRSYDERSLIVGSPGRVVREVSDAEVRLIRESAAHYVHSARDLSLIHI